jgi:hypothetical protein
MKLSDAEIEKLRQSGIRLDREGRFFHEGGEVTHPGMRRAFLRWMDRLPDGRPILRLDEKRFVYIELDADATPLLITALYDHTGDEAGGLRVVLNDGSDEALDPATLTLDPAGGARARVRRGLEARLTTAAYYALMQRVELGPEGKAQLRVGAGTVAIDVRPLGV